MLRGQRARASRGLLLLTGHGLAATAAGPGIGAGALSANGQTDAVTTATDAADVLQALHGHALLTAKIALEGVALGCTEQLLDIGIIQVLDAGVWVDTGLGQNLLGRGQADSVDVGQGDFDPLVARNINAGDTSH